MYLLIKNRWPITRITFAACLIYSAALICTELAVRLTSDTGYISSQIALTLKQAQTLVQAAENTSQQQQIIQALEKNAIIFFPALIIIGNSLFFLVMTYLYLTFNPQQPTWAPFGTIRNPRFIIWPLLMIWVFLLVDYRNVLALGAGTKAILLNTLWVILYLYLIQGCSIISHYLSTFKIKI